MKWILFAIIIYNGVRGRNIFIKDEYSNILKYILILLYYILFTSLYNIYSVKYILKLTHSKIITLFVISNKCKKI